MILETLILAGLAKLGCIVTVVKITKRKKQIAEKLERWRKKKKADR